MPTRETFHHADPYRSPSPLVAGPVHYGPLRAGVSAHVVRRGLLLRQIQLTAPIEGVLEFNGRGLRDTLRWNGQIVARRISWWRITPQLAFQIGTEQGPQEIVVSLRVWPWLALRAFRVVIGGVEVYNENG